MSTKPSLMRNSPILLGTGNPSKQNSLRWLLEDLPLAPMTPSQLGLAEAPDERGDTHQEIAIAKALDWSRSGSMLAIATDGGQQASGRLMGPAAVSIPHAPRPAPGFSR